MPEGSRKRTYSQSTLEVQDERRQRSRSPLARISQTISNFFEPRVDPTNPVINGASSSSQQRSFFGELVRAAISQAGRLGKNAGLASSLAMTKFFEGGYVDDRDYQMEQILDLAASLPANSKPLESLTTQFIKLLWNNLEHPPMSFQGNEFKYRTADGSNNNIMYPHLGKAGSYYARTVAPQTLRPGVLPDPGLIFDTIFARGKEAHEHPNKISSMLFYLATIIIHDCFHTDERNPSKVRTSSYLDLAPLYGSSLDDQKKVRLFKDGLLKPDTFSESRILGFPPGVAALLVCFNRYHNYVAMQLKEINEGGRFKVPIDKNDVKAAVNLDEDLFQTARLVTCGLYVNIILIDYVRTILNLNRTNSTWTLDPRVNFNKIFDSEGTPSGIGNQVSVEFNLLYRWHSAISKKDEEWTNKLYIKIFGHDALETLTEKELHVKLRMWLENLGSDPSKWSLDDGKYTRNERGAFSDKDLVNILSDATEDVACAFGPRNVPVVMRLIEIMGMKQARAWNVASLNELRKFFKLAPHKTFDDITKNESVARALKALYRHPDYVELYPGIVAEDAKDIMEPGSGLCPGYTISRAILADAVALTRGDRFYTIDNTPANLTNWGFSQIRSDPEVAQGGCIYNLLMRALPNWYRGNSIYAMFPFTVPEENREIQKKLEREDEYNYDRPSFTKMPIAVKTWNGVTSVLKDAARFGVPWGPHIYYISGHDYMLSGDTKANNIQRKQVWHAMHCPRHGHNQVREFYENLTTQLILIHSQSLRDGWFQLDACRDVGNPSHAIFTARLFHIPLKDKGSTYPFAVEVDRLYLGMAVLFAYVFLDLDAARSFKLRHAAKDAADGFAKLLEIVVNTVQAGETLNIDGIFGDDEADALMEDYGSELIRRLLRSERTTKEVVWTIISSCTGAVATQGQQFAQILDLYLRPEYQHHWPDIQACAWSNDPDDFEKLKGYALEAARLAPAAFGLLRKSRTNTTINDHGKKIPVETDDPVFVDFVTAGLDKDVWGEDPTQIDPTRDRDLYLHHGFGEHSCVGRPMVEVALAAQLKVFAKLKNLRRAPGPQGQMKSTIPLPNPVSSDPKPNPGSIEVYMKEDWSDWWPFPTTLKVHHDGFFSSQESYVHTPTGLPGLEEDIAEADMMNGVDGVNGVNGASGHDETA